MAERYIKLFGLNQDAIGAFCHPKKMQSSATNLNIDEYRDKVLGCWLGKNIGGTLGMPFEWHRQVNNVTFYTQPLTGEPVANDDLDIQLLWLMALERRGVDLDSRVLAEYWSLYLTPYWQEYGTSKANLLAGLVPPLSGSYGNVFKDSCGAFIRTEIWACIAPGAPTIVAGYAYEDASIDHGDGEGMWAAIFCATMESAAFVVSDFKKLIDLGLSYIPATSATAGAVRCAIEAHAQGKTWLEARDLILRDFRGAPFLNISHVCSKADREKGFGDGKLGFDAPSNIGLLVVALLYGKADFGDTICIATNCGEDTDCTAATAGALWGIIFGAKQIPQKWIDPIGRSIKTMCLNSGEIGGWLVKDVDDLTRRTEAVAQQVAFRHRPRVTISDRPTALEEVTADSLYAHGWKPAWGNLSGPLYHFGTYSIVIDYVDGPELRKDKPLRLIVKIYNTSHQAHLQLRWLGEEAVQVSPARESSLLSLPHFYNHPLAFEFEFSTTTTLSIPCRFVLELTVGGQNKVMLIPVVFLNGNVRSVEIKK